MEVFENKKEGCKNHTHVIANILKKEEERGRRKKGENRLLSHLV
jgi:hypothetical protein